MYGLFRTVNRLAVKLPVRPVHTSVWQRNKPPSAEQTASLAFDELKDIQSIEYKTIVNKFGSGITKVREHTFKTSNFLVSPRKLRLLGNQITGLTITEAIRQMEFSAKKPAKRIKSALVWARKNAIFQKQMNPDKMVLKLVRVGRGTKFPKKLDYKGRGRFGIIRKPKAHMTFVVWEQQDEKPVARNAVERALLAGELPKRKVKGFKLSRKVWTPLNEQKPVINPKPFYNW
ncbi:39S ribosomal protein L22, mitochondrial [Coemansia sp. RSA 989]|nr:ribosomal protein L22/L17 [Coemansia mojavensis]KAJ1741009.1 39S ribosomal protein L22, mitochondrial [Coemansia sp. RSA 1086]KAJ1749369.1 39S ribosomal protein L22, mitochondrial [Coemansia sp. RSA 1821]KAJ1863747.1 39S ribosomal protein L22, mitochondrial [Coemansia sp. RSA 989]KAJ1871577.1 39S ribosomal protein L22, mitochondrial [Coemansia sp. RSA 990]KAJ2671632.1 39S ribosomal protein L22, mitochondrial [Coemansia sp. RSA 1085]